MARSFVFILALAYTCAIAYLSLIDLAETPVKNLEISDKVMHAGAYFVMALLWSFFMIRYRKDRILLKIVIICSACCVFGIFIEVLQGVLTSYRDLDFYDMVANSIGAITAGMLLWLFKKNINQVKN